MDLQMRRFMYTAILGLVAYWFIFQLLLGWMLLQQGVRTF